MKKKKTVLQLARTLLVDSGGLGRTQASERGLAFEIDGKTYRDHDAYLDALQAAFDAWLAANAPTPRDALALALRRYRETYAGLRSPCGRPIPDHFVERADDEARRIMASEGVA